MDSAASIRKRISLRELEGKPALKNAFLRAFKKLQELPPENANSFWAIATYHGEPFKPRLVADPEENDTLKYWGGWCQHNDVLFPTWHRFYLHKLEQALRTVCPDDDLAFPYWDQTSEENIENGLPKILTDDTQIIDGVLCKNPLKSYIFQREIGEKSGSATDIYHKPKGYETVRYPYSGIRSPEAEKLIADEHNEQIDKDAVDDEEKDPVKLLNKNFNTMLMTGDKCIKSQYESCLNATTYCSFSNTVSAGKKKETAIESPHDGVHLALGGITTPKQKSGVKPGANGDMGENETAAFDPIFFFHHCNMDRVFWLWQKRHQFTDSLEIDPEDPGASPDGQGATPYQHVGEKLGMHTILHPFQHPNGVPVNSNDCVNIEKQLGYTYSEGSLEEFATPVETYAKNDHWLKVENFHQVSTYLGNVLSSKHPARYVIDISVAKEDNEQPTSLPFYKEKAPTATTNFKADMGVRFQWDNNVFYGMNKVVLHDVNRDLYPGSFFVSAYYKGQDIGSDAILDRWNPVLCKNCRKHRKIDVVFSLGDKVVTMPLKVADFKFVVSYSDPQKGTYEEKTIEIQGLRANVTGKPTNPTLSFYSIFKT
eukprot:gene9633-10621_t